jgi:hypothetical protein
MLQLHTVRNQAATRHFHQGGYQKLSNQDFGCGGQQRARHNQPTLSSIMSTSL